MHIIRLSQQHRVKLGSTEFFTGKCNIGSVHPLASRQVVTYFSDYMRAQKQTVRPAGAPSKEVNLTVKAIYVEMYQYCSTQMDVSIDVYTHSCAH